MAHFHGHDSSFIKGKQAERKRLILWLFILILVSAVILFFLYRVVWVSTAGIIGVLLIFAFTKDLMSDTGKDISKTLLRIFRMKGWADRGLLGERIVRQALEQLPDTYSVFRGIRPEHSFDVDFTVVGPNGVFTIEAKSQTGRIYFDRKGRGLRMLNQARREALAMYKYLLEGWKVKTFVV